MMQKIQMVDLKGQYEKIKPQIDNNIKEVIAKTTFINGPLVQEFQKELEKYLNVKHVIPCANGTDALQIALMALNLKKGDEVICPDFTFAATVEVIALLGLQPVLVDVNLDTFNICTNAIEKAISPKTKAIIPVHLFGQCAEMGKILEIAKKNNLFVIEDTAQALGADFTFSDGEKHKAGTIGNIGTTSFFPSKNLGCYGDGGAIFTNDTALAQKIKALANHGMHKRYYHELVGVNSRLDSLQAGVLLAKLPFLHTYNQARKKAAAYYTKAFEKCDKMKTPFFTSQKDHVFHQYTLQLDSSIDRNALQQYLKEKNIPTAIYYPLPLHKQNAYKNNTYENEHFKNTNALSKCVLSLPMHTELEKEQQDYIIKNVLDFLNF